MHALLRRLRLLLRGPAPAGRFSAAAQRAAYMQAQWLVRAFYLATMGVAFQLAVEAFTAVQEEQVSAPLWPVFWVQWVDAVAAARMLVLVLLGAAVFCVLWPERRPGRVLLAIAFVEMVALRLSFGYFYHHMHIWLWLTIVFAAFPLDRDWRHTLGRRSTLRHQSLTFFFMAQLLVGLFYSLSGLWKVLRGFITPDGYLSSFAPDALAALVFERWLNNAHATVLQDVFLANEWMGWPSHLFVMYVELFALVAVFRPAMQRPFGVALMAFHLGVWLLMGIPFWYQPMTIALLFVFSPFAASTGSLRADLRQVPLFGDLAVLLSSFGRVRRPVRA